MAPDPDRRARSVSGASQRRSSSVVTRGATAAAGSIAFLRLGVIDPSVAGPVAVGIVPGAMLGSWMVSRIRLRALRLVFLAFVGLMGVQMLLKAAGAAG